MSPAIHGRRVGSVTTLLRFQLLSHSVEVQVDNDAEAVEKLAYLVNGAEHCIEPDRVLRYRVRRGPPREVYAGADFVATAETPDDVLYLVYRDCYTRAVDSFTADGWVQLHAGPRRTRARRGAAPSRPR